MAKAAGVFISVGVYELTVSVRSPLAKKTFVKAAIGIGKISLSMLAVAPQAACLYNRIIVKTRVIEVNQPSLCIDGSAHTPEAAVRPAVRPGFDTLPVRVPACPVAAVLSAIGIIANALSVYFSLSEFAVVDGAPLKNISACAILTITSNAACLFPLPGRCLNGCFCRKLSPVPDTLLLVAGSINKHPLTVRHSIHEFSDIPTAVTMVKSPLPVHFSISKLAHVPFASGEYHDPLPLSAVPLKALRGQGSRQK